MRKGLILLRTSREIHLINAVLINTVQKEETISASDKSKLLDTVIILQEDLTHRNERDKRYSIHESND